MNKLSSEKVAELLKAVGHPTRLKIIELLEKEELSVGSIGERLGCPQAVISQHLTLMKDKGVLEKRRDGKNVFYTIKNKNVINLLHCVYHHCEQQDQD